MVSDFKRRLLERAPRLANLYGKLRGKPRYGDRAFLYSAKRDFFWRVFKALTFNGIDGDYVEFGSHGGMTFTLAWDEIARRGRTGKLWAFDSFQGLPEPEGPEDDHPVWKPGTLSTSEDAFHAICRRHGIPPDRYAVVPGYYDESLPALGADAAPRDICLAYVDCDLYSSTKTVLEFLAPRLKHGMVIAFDDYYCWSADQVSGERRAVREAFHDDEQWSLQPYIQYGWASQSFVVEDRALLG